MMFTIYKHTAPNGKVYIGVTSRTPNERWLNGKGYPHNKHFESAIKMYGWDNFRHDILFEGLTKDEAMQKEIDLIKEYRSNEREYGYNISKGGDLVRLGIKHTEETKKRISKACKGFKMSVEHRQRQSERLKGKEPYWCKIPSHTPEANQKRRETMMRTGCMKHKFLGADSPKAKAVMMFDMNGKYIKSFGAMSEAQKETNIDYGSIVKVCRGQRKSAGGYYWQYLKGEKGEAQDTFH